MLISVLYSYTDEPLEVSVVCLRPTALDFLILELCSVSKGREATGKNF